MTSPANFRDDKKTDDDEVVCAHQHALSAVLDALDNSAGGGAAAGAVASSSSAGIRGWLGRTAAPSRRAAGTDTAAPCSGGSNNHHVRPLLLYSSARASWIPAPPQHSATPDLPLQPQRRLGDAFLRHPGRALRTDEAPAAAGDDDGGGGGVGGSTGFVYHEDMLLHASGDPGECERPERAEAAYEHLSRAGVLRHCTRLRCPEATDEQLLAVHDATHVNRVESTAAYAAANLLSEHRYAGGDLYVSAGTARAARLAAGGVAEAAVRVATGEVTNAFALVRPPGHHCSATRASGFCFYNNVATAVRAAQRVEGVRRVMVLDWDVHHGDGTEAIFYDDPSVLVVSIHQHYFGRGHVQRKRPAPAVVKQTTRVDDAPRNGDLNGGFAAAASVAQGPAAVTAHEMMALLGATSSSSSSAAASSEAGSSSAASSGGSASESAVSRGATPHGGAEAADGIGKADCHDADPVSADGAAPVGTGADQEAAAGLGRRVGARRVPRRPLADNAADLDDAAALAFFGALGADVGGNCGVARDGEASSSGSSDGSGDEDSSQRLSWIKDAASGSSGPREAVAATPSGNGYDPKQQEEASLNSSSDLSATTTSDTDEDDSERPPFYPGTGVAHRVGAGAGRGRNINIPWPCVGFGDAEYQLVIDRLVVPIAHEFDPDMIVISSGFDCIAGDVLGSMHVTPTGIYLMTAAMCRVCPRVVVALEGGYTLRNVALSSEAAVRALLRASQGDAIAARDSTMLYHQTQRLIDDIAERHAPFWRCLRRPPRVEKTGDGAAVSSGAIVEDEFEAPWDA